MYYSLLLQKYLTLTMKVYKDLSTLGVIKNAVITIGSYDGVHAGHQKILEQVKQLSKEVNGESVLITFHPHPRLVLNPNDTSLRLLSTMDEKTEWVRKYGIDHLVFVPFSKEFSQLSPAEYVEDFIVKYFNPARIVIGYDHKFGKNRAGDIHFLKTQQEKYNFQVYEIAPQEVDNIVVSSTKIRKALSQGEVPVATDLLGHYYSLMGTVEKGQSIGKTIGFPTANIKIDDDHKLYPKGGSYAVYIYLKEQQHEGMMYLGRRPTLENYHNYVCEVNIFDFNKDIYGEQLRIEVVCRIRDDEKFSDLSRLKTQLFQDEVDARAVLKKIAQEQKLLQKNKPSVAVVILNYNGKNYLEKFLPYVMTSTYESMEVIVVDNASSDDSVTFVENTFPDITLISLHENFGFAEGYNQGLQGINADYFVLLNSDVEPEPNWIEPIIEQMENDKTIGVCQPKIRSYHARDTFEYAGAAGGWLDALGYPFCRGRVFSTLEKDEGQYNDNQEVFWATGAAMFVRGRLFHHLAGFDGRFFAHMEEIDFCWRVKKAGYKIMVIPSSVVYHVGGGTLNADNPFKTYLNFRNNITMLYKNESTQKLMWLLPLRLVLDGVAGGLFLCQGKFKHILSIVKAHWHFFAKMKEHRKESKANTAAIAKISIANYKPTGRYTKSIVWQYFVRRKNTFKEIFF